MLAEYLELISIHGCLAAIWIKEYPILKKLSQLFVQELMAPCERLLLLKFNEVENFLARKDMLANLTAKVTLNLLVKFVFLGI